MMVFAVLLLNRVSSHVNINGMLSFKSQYFHLASFVTVKVFCFVFKVQDHGKFLMGTDLIPTEHADQGIICPSILPVFIISHLEKT